MFRNSYMFMAFMLLDSEPGAAGGGTGGTPAPKADPPKEPTVAELMARIAALEAGKKDPAGAPAPKAEDDDLIAKAKKEREAAAGKQGDMKALEAALAFSMNADKWLQDNASVLPKDISDIFAASNKEKYDTPIEKDKALKSAIIQSFFGVQANLDLLTPALKIQLEDYLKLTKTGKQDEAQKIYDLLFEPSFEMLKRMKKAEALNKGYNGNSSQDAYVNKIAAGSRKKYLKET